MQTDANAIHIAYLTSHDPQDRKSLSGVFFYQSKILKEQFGKVTFLGPVKSLIIKILKRTFELIFNSDKKRYKVSHSYFISKIYAYIFQKKIKKKDFDVIFADRASTESAF